MTDPRLAWWLAVTASGFVASGIVHGWGASLSTLTVYTFGSAVTVMALRSR